MMRKQHKSATNVRQEQGFYSSPGLPEVAKESTPMSRANQSNGNMSMNLKQSPTEKEGVYQNKKGRVLEPLF